MNSLLQSYKISRTFLPKNIKVMSGGSKQFAHIFFPTPKKCGKIRYLTKDTRKNSKIKCPENLAIGDITQDHKEGIIWKT